MKNIVFFITFFIALNTQCIAQENSSRLHVKDFMVTQMPSLPDSKEQNTFLFIVLIDSINITNKVYFNIGSIKDSKDFLAITANVVRVGNEYVIVYNDKSYPVKNFTISIPVALNNVQNVKSLTATFYAEDNVKRTTEKLYHKIK